MPILTATWASGSTAGSAAIAACRSIAQFAGQPTYAVASARHRMFGIDIETGWFAQRAREHDTGRMTGLAAGLDPSLRRGNQSASPAGAARLSRPSVRIASSTRGDQLTAVFSRRQLRYCPLAENNGPGAMLMPLASASS